MKINLREKIFLIFVVCVIALILTSVYSYKRSQNFSQSNNLVIHTYKVIYELEQIIKAVIDAETGERGFVITKDESFLEPYYNTKSETFNHINNFRVLTTDNPIQQQNVVKLLEKTRKHYENLDNIIEISKLDINKAKNIIISGSGKTIVDEIRRITSDAVSIEQKLLEDREKKNAEEWKEFSYVFIILILLIIIILMVMYYIITSNINTIKRKEQETNDNNWLLTGNAKINDIIRDYKTLEEFTQSIIEFICNYLNQQIGILYIFQNNTLNPYASYAFKLNSEIQPINIGEGIIGQSALEKKIITIKNIPDDYIKIKSGLGEIKPKSLTIIPIYNDSFLKCVIEIGALESLSDLDLRFLELISKNISITINSIQANEQLKELLEETQRQSEELEVQQEELREFNDMLQDKNSMLIDSEESLKDQKNELNKINQTLIDNNIILEKTKQELITKADELEITGKYKSEFLANMSHELRTPLNSIIILSELLSQNKNRTLGAKDIEFSKIIFNSGKDLLNLINDILDLSKIESGKVEMDISNIDIDDLTQSLYLLFKEQANLKSINFEINNYSNIKNISSDHQKLSQILKNFLSNAFKFTSKNGSVSLEIKKLDHNLKIKEKTFEKDKYIVFSIKDSGIGIPIEKQEIIFEAFRQADGTTKRKFGGTGLGLSISKNLANNLGAEIALKSEPENGSEFILYLPINLNENNTVEDLNSDINYQDNKNIYEDNNIIPKDEKVILVIEDNIDFLNILVDFIRSLNYKCIAATDGLTGLKYAKEHKPVAIILDMNLPDISGEEVLSRLKNDSDLNKIPVQVISGFDKQNDVIELGAIGFIKKPINKNDLINQFKTIENIINKDLNKVLIVEDDENQNKAISELISKETIQTYSVLSGTEALNFLESDKVDCIIIDLGLPDMSGYDLIKNIRSNENLKEISIIVYTGKELTKEENNSILKLSNAIIVKSDNSHERLLDETLLFLHRVNNLSKDNKINISLENLEDEILENKSVLIVDDDIRNIYSLVGVLEQEKMQCITAENGEAALKILNQQNIHIDIILMDIMMPVMDGIEATKEIRKLKQFRDVPIIALTAKAMKGDKEKCLEVGMSDYISKPVNIKQLLSIMRVWLYK